MNEVTHGNKGEYDTIAGDLWHRKICLPSREVLTQLGPAGK